jgi:hypothetical protein
MTRLIISLSLMFCVSAGAKEAAPVAAGDQTGYIRALGRLNVNTASKDQLQQVPGLDSSKVDELLRVRTQAPISDLATLDLTDEVTVHLKTEGDSTFYRVRQNPLRRVDSTPASAAR